MVQVFGSNISADYLRLSFTEELKYQCTILILLIPYFSFSNYGNVQLE